jgi:S-adenosylmethionine:tRNA ribosyltransferase-isomerase
VTTVELEPRLEAHEPPEARGVARDGVALLVATTHDLGLVHALFRDLPDVLEAGDLLVVNTSATLPAAVDARLGEERLELRLSTPAPSTDERFWVVELRVPDDGAARPFGRPPARATLDLPGGAHAELVSPYAGGERLAIARLDLGEPLEDYLRRHGRPIRYEYVLDSWPLEAYQTVFALEPGSAEMPSAARPFTPELVTGLAARGVLFAPLTLHTGVSSPERGEPPYPERFSVPATTARLVNATRAWGGRVIAVGTTVVRALETVATPSGNVGEGSGWTDLVVTAERGLRAVDGLLTGWHEPESSHRQLLEAVAGRELVELSYREAQEHGYLWHEFGDSHLILP